MRNYNIRLLCLLLIIGGIIYVEGDPATDSGEDDEDNEIIAGSESAAGAFDKVQARWKRDVLKGKDHDLLRSKRYIGRVPVAYMKKITSLPVEPYEVEEPATGNQRSPVSHFREFQLRQGSKPERLNVEEPRALPLAGMTKSHKTLRRYVPSSLTRSEIANPQDDLPESLTDEDIQTLLLMLDGYDLSNGPNDRLAQMYSVGKRETGKRSLRNYEQPMNLDNAFYSGSSGPDRLEFLTDDRSKRIGARNLMAKTASNNNRVKKETDPKVLANLNKAFNSEKVPADSKHSHADKENHNEDAINEKLKKSVDWSNYFGLDKRGDKNPQQALSSKSIQAEPQPQQPNHFNVKSNKAIPPIAWPDNNNGKTTATVSGGKEASKKEQERKENETVNKEDDRDWILQEFYKNFAMNSAISKRKRESPALESENDLGKLEELEQKMMQAGDKIIWDALKYTGAHRDQNMSPDELSQVKNHVIEKLSTAFSLEKVRQAVDELRQEISALEDSEKKSHHN